MSTAYATANGVAVHRCRLCLPREGAWHGEFAVEDASAFEPGAIELTIGGYSFHGTGRRVGVVQGTGVVQLVAGAGGLHRQCTPKLYQDVPLNIPLKDILTAAGESLARSASPDATNKQLRQWAVTAGKCGSALNALIKLALKDSVWRFLPNGTMWVGTESWEPVNVGYEVLLADPVTDRLTVALESPSLLPGRTLEGRRVSYVEHHIQPDAVRSVLWFEGGTA